MKSLAVLVLLGRVASANCEAEKSAEDAAKQGIDKINAHSAWAKCMIDSGATPSQIVDQLEDNLLSTPKGRNLAWGVTLCAYAADRAERLAEIAKEKKYARLAGFVDKVKMYRLQQAIRRIDEEAASERATMKTYSVPVKPMACTHQLVRGLLACRTESEGQPGYCGEDAARAVLRSVKGPDEWDNED